ncbi:MAG TPA: alpha/beta hydrolase, partial [Ramlibacter sp.]
RRIWRWVQSGAALAAGRELHLGYGSEDRFAPGHALLGRTLPPQCVDVEPGAHDWATWRRLWNRYLDRHVHA